ncbi:MAG: transporter substrate-binding domain-containing protein [Pseudodesulfovibrio sp.]|nr:transporter substrate-binding domain-containing protein [Pseudodesulfovibrio sp.]
MKFVHLAFLILTLVTLGGQAMAQDSLTIATEGAYPPFNYIDENDNIAGFDVDIALALCKSMDVQCTIVTEKWDTILNGLTENRYDAVIASMAETPTRKKHADFSDYYYRSRSTFVADPTKNIRLTHKGLNGMILSAQIDTVQAEYLNKKYSNSATIKLASTTDEAFAMLAKDEVDAVLSDSLTIYDFLQTSKGKRFDFTGAPLPSNHTSSEACIAVRKGKPELVKAFNKAIRDIRLNGVYDKINRKYFPFSIY